MALIPLSQGMYALIDDTDWELVAGMSWYAHRERAGYYAQHNLGRKYGWKIIRLARYLLGVPDDVMVDHRNHNTMDYRRANLRVCDNQRNQWNAKLSVLNTSGYKGVCRGRNRWRAIITADGGKRLHIGSYETALEAARAYDSAALSYFGEFAATNERLGLLSATRSSKAGIE